MSNEAKRVEIVPEVRRDNLFGRYALFFPPDKRPVYIFVNTGLASVAAGT